MIVELSNGAIVETDMVYYLKKQLRKKSSLIINDLIINDIVIKYSVFESNNIDSDFNKIMGCMV